MKPNTEQIKRYIQHLDIQALKHIVMQLIEYPDSIKFIEKCIAEWSLFYMFPIDEDKQSAAELLKKYKEEW